MTHGFTREFVDRLVRQALAQDSVAGIEEAYLRVSRLRCQVSILLDDILQDSGCGKLWNKGHSIYLRLQSFINDLDDILSFALEGFNDLQRAYAGKRLMYQK